MSKLINEKKLQRSEANKKYELERKQYDKNHHKECLQFLSRFKNIVDEQQDFNNKIKFTYIGCQEFKAYVDSINNNPLNKIHIKCDAMPIKYDHHVSYIKTDIIINDANPEKDLVIYRLEDRTNSIKLIH